MASRERALLGVALWKQGAALAAKVTNRATVAAAAHASNLECNINMNISQFEFKCGIINHLHLVQVETIILIFINPNLITSNLYLELIFNLECHE